MHTTAFLVVRVSADIVSWHKGKTGLFFVGLLPCKHGLSEASKEIKQNGKQLHPLNSTENDQNVLCCYFCCFRVDDIVFKKSEKEPTNLLYAEFLSFTSMPLLHMEHITPVSVSWIHTHTMHSLLTSLYIIWFFQIRALKRKRGQQYVLEVRSDVLRVLYCASLHCSCPCIVSVL